MPISPALERHILNKSSDTEIRKTALEEGMFSLRMCAVEKMKAGEVSIDEVFAVTTSV
jgi:type II secretory ATPase GspE/PulE/Tfp pilus assembly ATPase PilB-like protein